MTKEKGPWTVYRRTCKDCQWKIVGNCRTMQSAIKFARKCVKQGYAIKIIKHMLVAKSA